MNQPDEFMYIMICAAALFLGIYLSQLIGGEAELPKWCKPFATAWDWIVEKIRTITPTGR
ncbi:hypothetical protein GCM10027061_21470 [Nesterenkonia suensis]